MSIFGRIKDSIFGKKEEAAQVEQVAAAAPAPAAGIAQVRSSGC